MLTPLNAANALGGLSAGGMSATELYGRVSKSLLAQNPGVQKLGAALQRDQTRLSGLGQLHSALANFQSLTQSLAGPGIQTGAFASNSAVLTALTNAGAKAGLYAVDVRQLAQAQVLSARAQQSQDGAIGDGAATTIRIELGTQAGNSFKPGGVAKTITIDSSNNSLKGIADALKAAGIEAAVLKGSGGFTLQLTGQSGSAGSLKISVGGDPELQKLLAYNPAGAKNLTQSKAAQDAILDVDGKQLVSAGNVILGAIPGAALALTGSGATQVTVGQDNAAIERNIGNLVSGFNNLAKKLDSLGQGELRTQPALAQAREQLARIIDRNETALAKLGVTLDRNGALQIDSKTLKAAVDADPQAVSALLTGGGKGLIDQLGAGIGALIGERGAISKQKVSLERDVGALEKHKAKLSDALKAQAGLLVSQYTRASQSGDVNAALPGFTGGGAGSLFSILG